MDFTQLPAPALEIIRKMGPYPDGGRIYPPQVWTPGTPEKRYINTIYRLRDGALQISGKAGTRKYYGYSRREAETLYNKEARARMSA